MLPDGEQRFGGVFLICEAFISHFQPKSKPYDDA
jgi:hypothetical protein